MSNKFNDYSRFMQPTIMRSFYIFGKEFKIKVKHTNLMLMLRAQDSMQEVQLLSKRAEAIKSDMMAQAELNGEKFENVIIDEEIQASQALISCYEEYDKCLKVLLGEKQFNVFSELGLSSTDYMLFIRILMGILQGASDEDIMKSLMEDEETDETNEGEL